MAVAKAVAEAGLVRPCCSCWGLFTPTEENAGAGAWAGVAVVLASCGDGVAGAWLVPSVDGMFDGAAAGGELACGAGAVTGSDGKCQAGSDGLGKG